MLLAAGFSADEMMVFIREFSLYNMLHLGLPSLGVRDMTNMKEHLATAVPGNDFTGLKIPFHIGVTNLNTGEQETHHSGPLHDLVAASCAIPFVFKPEPIGDYLYADGRITNNMVVTPLQDAGVPLVG
jgi:NTE family protein